jgi:methionyl-tRNA formyltransferase
MVKMRVVFLGTSEFAVPSLKALLENNYEVCGVFTQPDKRAGRGQKLQMSPVKQYALEMRLNIFQPEKIRDDSNRPLLQALKSDFIVVAAYGQLLPGWLLKSAGIAAVNVHGSLLPRYRGAAPVTWAILNGDTSTGVTTMLMDENLDTGAILLTREVPLPETMTGGELSEVLARLGAALLGPTLQGLINGEVVPILQDNAQATWAPKITKEMARIFWQKKAGEVHNLVRALNPWPIATTEYKGEKIQIFRSIPQQACSEGGEPGMYLGLTQHGMRVQCGEGSVLEVLELQRPGKARISGRAFVNGARIKPRQILFPDI